MLRCLPVLIASALSLLAPAQSIEMARSKIVQQDGPGSLHFVGYQATFKALATPLDFDSVKVSVPSAIGEVNLLWNGLVFQYRSPIYPIDFLYFRDFPRQSPFTPYVFGGTSQGNLVESEVRDRDSFDFARSPLVLNFDDMQAVDPSADFTIEVNGFSRGPQFDRSSSAIVVYDGGEVVYLQLNRPENTTEYLLPAGTLAPFKTYDVVLLHSQTSVDAGFGLNSRGDALMTYESIAATTLATVPEAGSWVAAGAVLCLLARRRR